MSMDFRKTTYRPTRTDNRFRTSYALMSQWMNRKGSAQAYKKEPLPQTFTLAMQGNSAFPGRPVRSANENGEYDPQRFMEQYQNAHLSAQQASIDENVPVHLRFNQTAGYDDFHKAFQQYSKQWPTSSFPEFGPARLRHGRAGGSWRHVKEVLQAGGARIVFVDGVMRMSDDIMMDEIPGGHLIQPRVGEIKSRYMTPSMQNKPSGIRRSKTEILARNEFHQTTPVTYRNDYDLQDFAVTRKVTKTPCHLTSRRLTPA